MVGWGGGQKSATDDGQRVSAYFAETCRPIPKLVAFRYSHSRIGKKGEFYETSVYLLNCCC
jgi:hypothetical protein